MLQYLESFDRILYPNNQQLHSHQFELLYYKVLNM